MMLQNSRKPGWLFYFGWVVASAVSLPLAFLIAFAIIAQVVKALGATIQVGGQTHITEDFLLLYIAVPLIGLLTGLLQFLLLRRYVPHMAWWMTATVLGWLLLLVLVNISPGLAFTSLHALTGTLIGGAIGLPQWWVLRPRVPHAAVWLVASVLGWCGAFLLSDGAMTIVLLPPMVASIAWWLLLDKLPQRKSNGSNSPSSASLLFGAH